MNPSQNSQWPAIDEPEGENASYGMVGRELPGLVDGIGKYFA